MDLSPPAPVILLEIVDNFLVLYSKIFGKFLSNFLISFFDWNWIYRPQVQFSHSGPPFKTFCNFFFCKFSKNTLKFFYPFLMPLNSSLYSSPPLSFKIFSTFTLKFFRNFKINILFWFTESKFINTALHSSFQESLYFFLGVIFWEIIEVFLTFHPPFTTAPCMRSVRGPLSKNFWQYLEHFSKITLKL